MEVTPATQPARDVPPQAGGTSDPVPQGMSQPVPMTPRHVALAVPERSLARYPGWSWWIILLAPFAVYVSGLVVEKTTAWQRTRSESKKKTAQVDLKSAGEALASGNKNQALQLAERALFEAIERATNIKARALMRSDIARVLSHNQVPADLATRIQTCLVQLETLRYGSEDDDPSALFAEASALVTELSFKKRKRKS
jgi:hypothetical protein